MSIYVYIIAASIAVLSFIILHENKKCGEELLSKYPKDDCYEDNLKKIKKTAKKASADFINEKIIYRSIAGSVVEGEIREEIKKEHPHFFDD